MNYIKSKGLIEDRIYISPQLSTQTLKKTIYQNNNEQKGAGVRCYGRLAGSILERLGFATQIKLNNKTIYVNNQSLCKIVIRINELKGEMPAEESALKLHKLYQDHQKLGYDQKQLKAVNRALDMLKLVHETDFKLIINVLSEPAGFNQPPATQKNAAASTKQAAAQKADNDPRKNRRHPPLSQVDTVRVDHLGKTASAHGQGDLFKDKEIVEVHQVVDKQLISNDPPEKKPQDNNFELSNPFATHFSPVYVEYSNNRKAIIQQQAIRGCTAAAAAMLIVDMGGQCNVDTLRMRNLGDKDHICRDIRKAGFTPLLTERVKSISQIRKAIEENGPAIVSIDGELGGHVIVVDYIDDKIARLRDPYHGWEISVSIQALRKRISKNEYMIQITQTLQEGA